MFGNTDMYVFGVVWVRDVQGGAWGLEDEWYVESLRALFKCSAFKLGFSRTLVFSARFA